MEGERERRRRRGGRRRKAARRGKGTEEKEEERRGEEEKGWKGNLSLLAFWSSLLRHLTSRHVRGPSRVFQSSRAPK